MKPTAAEQVRCVMPGAAAYTGLQGPDYTPGISAETVGARGIWLGTVTLPAGGRTKAHAHEDHESALYLVEGREVEVFTGALLENREVARPGDFIYFPPGMPHVAVNRTDAPALFVASRTDPTEQESILLRADLDPLVP